MVYHVFYTNLVLHPMATQVPKNGRPTKNVRFCFLLNSQIADPYTG